MPGKAPGPAARCRPVLATHPADGWNPGQGANGLERDPEEDEKAWRTNSGRWHEPDLGAAQDVEQLSIERELLRLEAHRGRAAGGAASARSAP